MRLVKRDAPDQACRLMAAAGTFAAVSSIFGSPVIGAVLIIEASGLGGADPPLVLLPGLLAAGVGSLVFIGLGSFSGFSTAAWQLSPVSAALVRRAWLGRLRLDDPARGGRRGRRLRDHGARPLVKAARRPASVPAHDRSRARGWRARDRLRGSNRRVARRRALLGSEAFGTLFGQAATVSLSTLALLLLFKGLAWSISLGNFRGGPPSPRSSSASPPA